jgi:hypothetical protein
MRLAILRPDEEVTGKKKNGAEGVQRRVQVREL